VNGHAINVDSRAAVDINRESTAVNAGSPMRTPAGPGLRTSHVGLFKIPDSEFGALGDLEGLDVVEPAAERRISPRGSPPRAHPVGVDVTPAQLETAAVARNTSVAFPSSTSAEDVPLPARYFDLAVAANTGRACGATPTWTQKLRVCSGRVDAWSS
jgi:hypothetical protein